MCCTVQQHIVQQYRTFFRIHFKFSISNIISCSIQPYTSNPIHSNQIMSHHNSCYPLILTYTKFNRKNRTGHTVTMDPGSADNQNVKSTIFFFFIICCHSSLFLEQYFIIILFSQNKIILRFVYDGTQNTYKIQTYKQDRCL